MRFINSFPNLTELSTESIDFFGSRMVNNKDFLINRTVKHLSIKYMYELGHSGCGLMSFTRVLLSYFMALETCIIHRPHCYRITISKPEWAINFNIDEQIIAIERIGKRDASII